MAHFQRSLGAALLRTALSLALAVGLSSPARAFDGNANTAGYTGTNISGLTCQVLRETDSNFGNSILDLADAAVTQLFTATAEDLVAGVTQPTGPVVTVSDLQNICTELSNVTIVSQRSPTTSFAGASYHGIVFRGTQGGVRYEWEVAVSGVTNTTFINTRTAIVPTLGLTASTTAGQKTAGVNFTYTITPSAQIANTSGALTLSSTLPATLSYVSASGTGWTCSAPGGTLSCTSNLSISADSNGQPVTLTVTPTTSGTVSTTFSLSGGGASNSPTAIVGPTTVNAAVATTLAQATVSLTQGSVANVTPVTATGGTAPVTFSVNPALPAGLTLGPSNGTITGTPSTPSAAATYTITATDTNGSSSARNITLSVAAATPTLISISPSFGNETGGTIVTLTGTFLTGATAVSFGGTPAVSFSVDAASQITATSPAGTGLVDIRVTTPGGTTANTAADDFAYRADQTITFPQPGTQTFGTTPTLSVTATSGLPIEFSSSTTGVCTITSGGALTFITSGTCTIDANQSGNGSFFAAPTVSRTFTVAAIVPNAPVIGTATAGNTQATVSFTAPDSTGGAALSGYTVTASPGGATGTGASSPITVTGLTNGVAYTFTVTATNSAGTGAASAASNTVTPAEPQTITFPNPGTQTFGTTPTLSAGATSNLTVTFTSSTTGVCSVTSGGLLTFVTAGTCTINADQAGNSAWLPASQVSRSFTVSPAVASAPTNVTAVAGDTQASISFTAPANTGGTFITGYTLTVSPPDVAPVNGASSPIVVTGLTNGQAYTFTVTADNAAGTSPASAPSNSITPAATQTITFNNPGSQNFGTSPTLAAITDAVGLTPTFTSSTPSVCTITPGGTLTFISAGTCTINADQAGNLTYLPASRVTRSFAVMGTAAVVLSASGGTFSAGVPVTLTATVTGPSPTGTVTFSDGATTLGTATLSSGAASLTTTFAGGSTPSVTAAYSGDTFHNAAVSATLTLTEAVDSPSEDIAQTMAQSRMRNLFLGQPDLTQFARGGSTRAFGLTVSAMNGQIDWFRPDGPVWFRLSANRSSGGGAESHYALLSFGTHRSLGDGSLFGVMGQIDSIGFTDATGSGKATGWLAGPYGVTRVGTLPIWVEGRLLVGKSDNRMTPTGAATDRTDGDRFLGLVKLSGEIASDQAVWAPYLSYGAGTERLDAFTSSLGVPVAANEQRRTELSAGLDLGWSVPVLTGSLALDSGFGIVATGGDVAKETALRLRFGLDRVSANGTRSFLRITTQGGGSSTTRSLAADIGLELDF